MGGGRITTIWRTALGGTLVAAGLLGLVLPGPGLLILFAGVVVLSQRYMWARRKVLPVKRAALRVAVESVRSWGRIALSSLGTVLLLAAGALWTWRPAAPAWWQLGEFWWLPGGRAAGGAMFISGIAALATIVYSIRHYRGISSVERCDGSREQH